MSGMDAIKQTFFEECDEQLIELERGLLEIDEGSGDRETVNAVFRAVHSIKGGAGAFQLHDLVHFAHTFETTLDLVRESKLEAGPDVMRTMLRASDVLADLVSGARNDQVVPRENWEPIVAELASYCGDRAEDAVDAGTEEGQAEDDFQPLTISLDDFGGDDDEDACGDDQPNEFEIHFKPRQELYSSANEPCLLLKELCRLGDAKVNCSIDDVPSLDELEPGGAHICWTISLTTTETESTIREVFEFVDDCCDLDITAKIAEVELLPSLDDSFDLVAPELSEPAEAAELAAEAAAAESAEELAHQIDSPPEAKGPSESDAAPSIDKAAPTQTIRADLKRVDRLINLVGELVINQAMLSQSVTRAGLESATDVVTGLDELEQLTRQIQDSVMAIRAQPVKPMFQRMSRVVREAADATGKMARLKLEGDSTEVDKTVVEKLADPLTHMIRNAVDHGLESPEARNNAGKPEEGVVRLSAAHRSGRVVIEVSDDGAGINRERVRSIAVDKGIITQDAQLSDTEIDNLIFAPGFSTATEVSDLSGRGVGMDVVKRSIQAIGGRVSISSNPGKGSTFVLSLPLTLAVLDGMIVSVANQTLVVPITAIVETLQPSSDNIHQMGSDTQVISVRDRFVPLIDTGLQLGFREDAANPENGVVVLIETDDGESSALLVDSIQDQSQVVIKSLESNYGQVNGIAAATILGDGRVALIADVDGLVEQARIEPVKSEPLLALAG